MTRGIGSAATLSFAQPTEAASKAGAVQSGGGGVGGTSEISGKGQNSASISGLGQLLSNLQQVQTQNPGQFPQLVSQIAGALQSAAAVHTGGASQLLINLAGSFEKAATSGALPQLHQGTETHSYSKTGQPVTTTAVTGPAASAGSQLQQLFASLASQLGGAQA
jgi:hypothetical protein